MPHNSPTGPDGATLTRALTRSGSRPPVARRPGGGTGQLAIAAHEVALAAASALPALGRTLVVAAVAFAAERALSATLSATVGGTVGRLLAPIERAAPAFTRTEITEWVMIERIRRR